MNIAIMEGLFRMQLVMTEAVAIVFWMAIGIIGVFAVALLLILAKKTANFVSRLRVKEGE